MAVLSTPLGFDSTAQGRERSERTLGQRPGAAINPERVEQFWGTQKRIMEPSL